MGVESLGASEWVCECESASGMAAWIGEAMSAAKVTMAPLSPFRIDWSDFACEFACIDCTVFRSSWSAGWC